MAKKNRLAGDNQAIQVVQNSRGKTQVLLHTADFRPQTLNNALFQP